MSSSAMRISSPRLPRWAPLLVAAMALAMAGLPAILSGWSVVQWVLAATVVFLIAMPLWSRFVEGPRAAVDRLVTALVWVSFAFAMVVSMRSCLNRLVAMFRSSERRCELVMPS